MRRARPSTQPWPIKWRKTTILTHNSARWEQCIKYLIRVFVRVVCAAVQLCYMSARDVHQSVCVCDQPVSRGSRLPSAQNSSARPLLCIWHTAQLRIRTRKLCPYTHIRTMLSYITKTTMFAVSKFHPWQFGPKRQPRTIAIESQTEPTVGQARRRSEPKKKHSIILFVCKHLQNKQIIFSYVIQKSFIDAWTFKALVEWTEISVPIHILPVAII